MTQFISGGPVNKSLVTCQQAQTTPLARLSPKPPESEALFQNEQEVLWPVASSGPHRCQGAAPSPASCLIPRGLTLLPIPESECLETVHAGAERGRTKARVLTECHLECMTISDTNEKGKKKRRLEIYSWLLSNQNL